MLLNMPLPDQTIKKVFSLLLITSVSFVSLQAQTIKGKIISANDKKPAAFASIKLLNRTSGCVSDAAGNFLLPVHTLRSTDTLLISLVGYDNLKIAAKKAVTQAEFTLQQSQKTLDAVVVRSFSKEEIAGAKTEIVGYFRSWNTDNTGGEIGRTFLTNHKEYQVAKVRFKVYNTYDTCIIRLRIREMVNGQPGRELLRDSVAQIIKPTIGTDKAYEFNLSNYNIILTQPNIFVSFQVLDGTSTDHTSRSLSFMGSEEGNYIYKSGEYNDWRSSDDYTIYMKLLLKYDD
jgi:hypothetical protein